MTLALALALLLFSPQAPANQPTIAGTWEGSSLCTVPNSPCHDEHVVYHIKATDPNNPTKFAIDANKVVNGTEDSMGTLECKFTAEKNELHCGTSGDWRFTVTGKEMDGTLRLKDGTLYRRIRLKKE